MSRQSVTRTTQVTNRTSLYDNYSKGTDGTLLDSFSTTNAISLINGASFSLDNTSSHFYKANGSGVEITSTNGVLTTIEKTVNWNMSSIQNLCFWIYLQAGDQNAYPQDYTTFIQSCTGLELSTSGGFGASDTYFTWTFDPNRYFTGRFRVLIDKNEFTAVNSASWANPITKIRLSILSQPSYTVSITYSDFTLNDIRKPVFIFTHDDIHLSEYQNAIPILEKYGFRCSLAFVSNWCTSGNGSIPTMNLSQVKELYNKGHEVFNHTSTHGYTDDATIGPQILGDCRTYMQSNGLTGSEDICAWPSGNTSPAAEATIAQAGFTYGRTIMYEPVTGITALPIAENLLIKSNYICTGNDGVSTQIDPPRTLSQVKGMVDYCIANGHTMLFTFHGIVDNPSAIGSTYYWGNLWATADYQSLVQYIFGYTSTGQAQVMKYGDWIKGFVARQQASTRTSV